jgi:hypothetical protein
LIDIKQEYKQPLSIKMNRSILLLLPTWLLLSSVMLQAEQVMSKVLVSSGQVTATLPTGSSMSLKEGDRVPVGAKIKTSDNGVLMLGLMPGAATILEPNTVASINKLDVQRSGDKVVKRDVQLSLDSTEGGLLSTLKQLDDNVNFSIRTPNGVAAARGTVWRTTSDKIQVINGDVVYTGSDGTTVSIPGGNQYTDGDETIVELTDQELNDLIQALEQAGISVTVSTFDGRREIIINDGSDNPATFTETEESPSAPRESGEENGDHFGDVEVPYFETS